MHTEVYKCAATLSPWTEAFCIQNSVYVFVRTVLHSKPFVIIIIENENCNGNMPNELPVHRCVRTRLSLCLIYICVSVVFQRWILYFCLCFFSQSNILLRIIFIISKMFEIFWVCVRSPGLQFGSVRECAVCPV